MIFLMMKTCHDGFWCDGSTQTMLTINKEKEAICGFINMLALCCKYCPPVDYLLDYFFLTFLTGLWK